MVAHTVGTVPPSITYSLPVIDEARSEMRNATSSATSSGGPGRPIGIATIWKREDVVKASENGKNFVTMLKISMNFNLKGNYIKEVTCFGKTPYMHI